MSKPWVFFHRLAQAEYRNGLAWYNSRSTVAASRFRDAVGRAIQRIEDEFEMLPRIGRNYRYVRVIRFPYTIVCRERSESSIEIVAVAHTSRRPNYWRHRK